MSTTPINLVLPTYIQNQDQENYAQELNQTLQEYFGETAWSPPLLTNAQAAASVATGEVRTGSFWYNTDLDKIQFVNSAGMIETVTSV